MVCGTMGAQPASLVMPATAAMRPACCAGMTLQTSTFMASPSTTTSMASGRTSTLSPPKSGPMRSTMPG